MAAERVRIFVDFWNFVLAWNEFQRAQGRDPNQARIPWRDLLPAAVVGRVNPQARYVGTHVYASVDPQAQADRKLSGFLHAMDGFPGYNVMVKERRPLRPPQCSSCRSQITACPSCKEPIRRTVEKGIDAALLTDLIRTAFDDTFDQAVLITEDSDFVPAVKFIQERWTKQIVHCFFRGKSDALRNACWRHIFFDDIMTELIPASSSNSPSTLT